MKSLADMIKQSGNYVLNHWGEVWDISNNECIYSSNYKDALEFFNNITK